MNCCEADRKTPYCPLCGKRLGDDSPLGSLLAYLRRFATKQETMSRNLREELHEDPANKYLLDRIKDGDTAQMKWNTWVDAVTKVLAEQETKP